MGAGGGKERAFQSNDFESAVVPGLPAGRPKRSSSTIAKKRNSTAIPNNNNNNSNRASGSFSHQNFVSPSSSASSSPSSNSSSTYTSPATTPHKFKDTSTAVEGIDEDGHKMINQYVILKKLGSGSYGKVKLVMNSETNEAFALKVMNKTVLKKVRKAGSNALQDVKREIAILKKLDHKNIVRLFEVIDDEETDKLFLVLEFVENGELLSLGPDGSSPHGPLQIDTARKYFRDMIEGLEYLHSQKVLHRDIKPENCLLDKNYNAKLSDFGVSYIFEGDNDIINETAGTPAFLSPEAVSTQRFAGKPNDVWALGVTLYVLVFGKCPFIADNYGTMYEMIKTQAPEIPENTNPFLKDLLLRILEKDPVKRITIPQLKKHPWVTNDGTTPLNTIQQEAISISNEEVDKAIVTRKLSDKVMMMIRMKAKFAKKAEKAREAVEERKLNNQLSSLAISNSDQTFNEVTPSSQEEPKPSQETSTQTPKANTATAATQTSPNPAETMDSNLMVKSHENNSESIIFNENKNNYVSDV